MKLKITSIVMLYITLLSPLGNGQFANALVSRDISLSKGALKKLLPKDSELNGWESSSVPQFYEPENLWEYINGEAELYLQYGFRSVVTSYYMAKNDSNSLNIEIYQMESPHHAFGIYAAERSPEDNYIEMGVQGYTGENILNFWKGPFYIKLTSYQDSISTDEIILKFAHIIASKIEGDYREPELFTCFPEENRVKMSERYIPQNFLGHSFFKNGYRVDYDRKGYHYQVFLVENKSEAEARESFEKYLAFLSTQNKIISSKMILDYQIVKIEGDKKRITFLYKSTLGGILDIEDFEEAEEIVGEIIKRLKSRN